MSVAFRREGDDEHLEPKFELPLPPGPNLVTARGLGQICAKVAELEATLATLTGETEIAATRRDLRYWQTRQVTAELVDAVAKVAGGGAYVTASLADAEPDIEAVETREATRDALHDHGLDLGAPREPRRARDRAG